jgi:hypothetical protein
MFPISSCWPEERGENEKPRATGGVSDFLRVCWRLTVQCARKSDPPDGGFFGFRREAALHHAGNIAAAHTDVNEAAKLIHAAETSRAYTARPDFTEDSP